MSIEDDSAIENDDISTAFGDEFGAVGVLVALILVLIVGFRTERIT